ncbi:hypothetical protein AOLI_G00272600 [Acnodon oligacanthus]
MDICSRVAVLRLQAAQLLLYHQRHAWMDLACALLRVAGHMCLDRHLFSLSLGTVDLGGLNAKIFEEPLFFNSVFPTPSRVSGAQRVSFLEAGISKLRHVRRECLDSAPVEDCRSVMGFPELVVRVEREDWQDGQGELLSLGTPALGNFSGLNKRSLYSAGTKVLNFRSLMDLREAKWTEVAGADSPPKDHISDTAFKELHPVSLNIRHTEQHHPPHHRSDIKP